MNKNAAWHRKNKYWKYVNADKAPNTLSSELW